MRMVNCHVLHC